MRLFLSRLRLARHPSNDALRPLIDPAVGGRRIDAHHRLIWAAFADAPDRHRDFLWRDEGSGRFTVLSAHAPMAAGLFEPPEVKVFAPDLAAATGCASTCARTRRARCGPIRRTCRGAAASG